jgi:hypothetical protein
MIRRSYALLPQQSQWGIRPRPRESSTHRGGAGASFERGCPSTRPGAQISVGQSQPGGAAQVGERNCRLPLDRWQQPATAVGKQAELDVVPKCWPVRPPPPIDIYGGTPVGSARYPKPVSRPTEKKTMLGAGSQLARFFMNGLTVVRQLAPHTGHP